ncbi:MAG: hypothetical protein AAF743_08500 [Planctomycetota bacterium]
MRQTLRGIYLILTLRCEEAEMIRLRAREGDAGKLEKIAEFLHRMICKPCRHAATQSAKLDATLEHGRAKNEENDIFL